MLYVQKQTNRAVKLISFSYMYITAARPVIKPQVAASFEHA